MIFQVELTKIEWNVELIFISMNTKWFASKIKSKQRFLMNMLMTENVCKIIKTTYFPYFNLMVHDFKKVFDKEIINPSILPLASISILITSLEKDSLDNPTITL